MRQAEPEGKKGFFSTTIGIITQITALLVAISGLIAALNNFSCSKSESRTIAEDAKPFDTTQTKPVTNTHIDEIRNIAGTWMEYESPKSIIVLEQSRNRINMKWTVNNIAFTTGAGTIEGGYIELRFQNFGKPSVYKATLSSDGNSIEGAIEDLTGVDPPAHNMKFVRVSY
jgi:hypothetical protein